MAVEMWKNTPYLVSRWVLWLVVLGAALIDWVVHRSVRTRGWQLHRSVVVVVALSFVKECVTLVWSQMADTSPTYFAVIFFYDLADAAFMCLLMVIASGWKITRDTLEGYKFGLVLGPMLFFFSDIIVDYIVEEQIGHSGVQTHKITISSDTLRNVLLFASALNAGALFYLWIWIFQSNKIERRKLEIKMMVQRNDIPIVVLRRALGEEAPAPVEGAPPAYSDTAANAAPGSARTSTANLNAAAARSSERLSSANEEAPAADPSTNPFAPPPSSDLPPAYASVASPPDATVPIPTGASNGAASEDDEEDDSPFAPADSNGQIPDMAKLRLLSQFNFVVSLYFFVIIGLLVWEVYQNRILPPMVVISDIATLVFMASLAFIFRLREKNPYFLLSDYAASAPNDAPPNVFGRSASRNQNDAGEAGEAGEAPVAGHVFHFAPMSNDDDED